MEDKLKQKEKVICDTCGGTRWYQAPIVQARCAYCHQPVWPMDPETKKPLYEQEVPVNTIH